MGLIDADKFLTELTRLFEKHKGKGTVWVTMKRSNMKPPPKKGKEPAAAQGPDGGDSAEHRCLVRATDGKKKFSTVLAPNQIAKFHSAYTTLQKARAIFCPDKLPVRGAEVRLRSQLKRALHHVQAHMDSLKSKKKEKKKPTKGPVAKKPEGKGHSTRA